MTLESEQKKKKSGSVRDARRRGRGSRHRTLPNIFFCGDPHGEFEHINEAVRQHRPDAIVILGDLQPREDLDLALKDAMELTEVWWIPGNHDSDSDEIYDRLWHGPLAKRNLHGRVAKVAGLSIAGLGGVFRGQVWMPEGRPNYVCPAALIRRIGKLNLWRGGLPRRQRTTIFPSLYRNLSRMHADVLVTHEAPGCHRKGFAALDRLARALGVRWMFHGHQHEDRVYGKHQGVTVRAVGYRGIVNLKGDVIVPAQMDPREAAQLEAAYAWVSRTAEPSAPEPKDTSVAGRPLLGFTARLELPAPAAPLVIMRSAGLTEPSPITAVGEVDAKHAPAVRSRTAGEGTSKRRRPRRKRFHRIIKKS